MLFVIYWKNNGLTLIAKFCLYETIWFVKTLPLGTTDYFEPLNNRSNKHYFLAVHIFLISDLKMSSLLLRASMSEETETLIFNGHSVLHNLARKNDIQKFHYNWQYLQDHLQESSAFASSGVLNKNRVKEAK